MASSPTKKNTFKAEKTEKAEKVASPKKSTTPKGPKKKKKVSTNKQGQARIILGIFFILFAAYSALAFTSYLFQWFGFGNDDAILNFSIRELMNKNIQHNNWGGRVGASLAYHFIHQWFGVASYLISFYIFLWGVYLATKVQLLKLGSTLRYIVALIVWISLTTGFLFYNSNSLSILGGVFGYQGITLLFSVTGKVGTGFILLFYLMTITTIAFNIPFRWINIEKIQKRIAEKKKQSEEDKKLRKAQKQKEKEEQAKQKREQESAQSDANEQEEEDLKTPPPSANRINRTPGMPEEEAADDFEPVENILPPTNGSEKKAKDKEEIEFTIERPAPKEEEADFKDLPDHQGLDTEFDPTLDLPHYKMPHKDFLYNYDSDKDIQIEKKELEENKKQIVETLNNYQIKIVSIKATPGPSITLYEIVPAPGIRISKIKNLEDDIAMSLAAHGIRIIAPIPGRGTIGIEVPNSNPQTVAMKTILSARKFVHSDYELPIGLGKTISNESYIADLAKMPHLLMAGATGQGKSVGLNAIITSLLYKKHPSLLKFILVDPKKVELSLYNKIERHYLAKLPDNEEAIITDTREVVRTLNSLVIEMEDRYNLLKDAQVKSIAEYNRKFNSRRLNPEKGHRFMPYIVVVIDEFADLIMTAGKEIEGPITRLAQLARAIGIHLIIATQRPSVNIITGSIKANFPARIAFRVISKVDSRTILDSGGADQLVGRGDMLLSTGKEIVRIQGAFIDTEEIDALTEYIGSQRAYPEAYKLPEYFDEETETSKDLEDLGRDELFEDAARMVVNSQHGSTSLLQRKMKIGYNRAGRIIDQLEAAGIVGSFEGSKAREVLIKDAVALEQLLEEINSNEQ